MEHPLLLPPLSMAKARVKHPLLPPPPQSALWDSLFCLSLLSPELCVWNDIYFSLWQHTVTAALTFSQADIPTGMTLMPLGRNQSRFATCLCVATMPVAPLRAPSALLGKWSEHVGPKWIPRREQALSAVILLPIFSFKCSHWHVFFLSFSFLSLLPLPVRGLVSCFSPGCRVLGELGFCELEKERTSVWSALISVEKDLIVPGFWDHYLSFSFIKSVMRKFKIKGFVNWIPVWKGGTYQEVSAEACRWATGNNTRLEHLSSAALTRILCQGMEGR